MDNETLQNLMKVGSVPIPLGSLGNLFVATRKERGLTQEQLASQLGMFQEALARLEREKYRTVSLERLVRVANTLKLDLQVSLTPEHAASAR